MLGHNPRAELAILNQTYRALEGHLQLPHSISHGDHFLEDLLYRQKIIVIESSLQGKSRVCSNVFFKSYIV